MFIKANEKDISIIRHLAKESWEWAYADILEQDQIRYMLDKMYSDDELLSHFQNPNFHYYIIRQSQKELGFAGFEFHYEQKTTKLHRLYFLREAKGKGLGKKTIEFIRQKALGAKDTRIILTVNKNNSAKRFYQSQGFTIYQEAVFDIGNGYVMDDYLMELTITPNP